MVRRPPMVDHADGGAGVKGMDDERPCLRMAIRRDVIIGWNHLHNGTRLLLMEDTHMNWQPKIWGRTCRLPDPMPNIHQHLLEIDPSTYCSEHMHEHRSSTLLVLQGMLDVLTWRRGLLGEQIQTQARLGPGEHVELPAYVWHQFRCPEEAPSVTTVLETYVALPGHECSEDDITRRTSGGRVLHAQEWTKVPHGAVVIATTKSLTREGVVHSTWKLRDQYGCTCEGWQYRQRCKHVDEAIVGSLTLAQVQMVQRLLKG